MNTRLLPRLSLIAILAAGLAACAPAASPAPAPSQPGEATQAAGAAATQVVKETKVAEVQTRPASSPAPTEAPLPTQAPAAGGTSPTPAASPTRSLATSIAPTPTSAVEARVVELEWPPRMRLGDSDSVRLALIPSVGGYTVTTEFPDNTIVTQTVNLARPGGYDLFGVARLEGVGFEIMPAAEQMIRLPAGEPVTWRWTLTPRASGQHRLTVNLALRWVGAPPLNETRDAQLYSRTLTVQVTSFLGLTTGQAMWMGVLGLMVGGGMSVAALTFQLKPRTVAPKPNPTLAIEPPPGLMLSAGERTLLQVLFRRYTRVIIENEFRSGYSGARTLLALPVRADGRADAHTIVKIGERRAMEREHHNYETYVKDTLPPMTARIQDAPVVAAPGPQPSTSKVALAALRYTFIAEPGHRPMSLREALLKNPDPALVTKLFETFGPNWWMQRRAHTFRLAQEYDRLLTAHLVLEPLPANARQRPGDVASLEERTAPSATAAAVNDTVRVGRFAEVEVRQDGRSLSLTGAAQAGEPPLRVRWLGLQPPDGTLARVAATRETLLREFVSQADLLGLADPLPRLPDLLAETVVGSQSIVHGDLNLENVLVGPGGFVWLIDFARTRDGHPLFDFAHLEAEIIAHIVAPQLASPRHYLELWSSVSDFQPTHLHPSSLQALLSTLHQIAARCLANPARPREYHLALCLACLGALKYPTIDARGRGLLYLTAAHLAQSF